MLAAIENNWIQRGLKHIWHPCTQMKDFETCPPLLVHKAQGSFLYTDQGVLIDAISSWWCKPLGHRHPAVLAAIKRQLDAFEHVMPTNTTHPTLIELGEMLAGLKVLTEVLPPEPFGPVMCAATWLSELISQALLGSVITTSAEPTGVLVPAGADLVWPLQVL